MLNAHILHGFRLYQLCRTQCRRPHPNRSTNTRDIHVLVKFISVCSHVLAITFYMDCSDVRASLSFLNNFFNTDLYAKCTYFTWF